MVNTGGDWNLEVYVTDMDGNVASNCDIREISIDGVYLPEPRKMHVGQTLLVPGGKVDWLIKCNVPGTYKVIALVTTNHSSFIVIDQYDMSLNISVG